MALPIMQLQSLMISDLTKVLSFIFTKNLAELWLNHFRFFFKKFDKGTIEDQAILGELKRSNSERASAFTSFIESNKQVNTFNYRKIFLHFLKAKLCFSLYKIKYILFSYPGLILNKILAI